LALCSTCVKCYASHQVIYKVKWVKWQPCLTSLHSGLGDLVPGHSGRWSLLLQSIVHKCV